MFNLTNHPATLASLNTRTEKHGEDNVPACDLKIKTTMVAAMAEALIPGLRASFFRKPTVGEQQNLLDDDNRTQVKYAHMSAPKFDITLTGYALEIERGMGMSKPIVLQGVELKRFEAAFADGPSVELTFTASCHPDKSVVAELYEMQQEDVQITLVPPKTARAPRAAKPAKSSPEGSQAASDNDSQEGLALDPEAAASLAQANAVADALQAGPVRAQLRAFIFESDEDAVWAGITAADAAMTAFTETGETYDADACRELTDAELDRDFPETDDDENPTGERTTLRAILAGMTEPGIVCELSGPLDPAAAVAPASNDDDVDVRPALLKLHDPERKAG